MITQANWRKYIDRLAAIDKKAADLMQMYIDEHGLQDTEALIQYAYALVTKYGETSATLASEMYDHMAELMNAGVPKALPAETASLKEVAKGVTWGKYHSPSQIPSVVGRQVRQAGSDTMIQNAKRDKAQWAWVPQGDTCAFCITLASRGWQDASKTVLKGNHADHIHQNCDCTFAIAFKPSDRKQYDYIYDPDKYMDMYNEAGGDINEIRRRIYVKRKDEINAQRRDTYQAKFIDEYHPPIQTGGRETGGHHYRLSPEDTKRDRQAANKYEEFAKVNDSSIISKTSGLSIEEIDRIRSHIFFKKHNLYDGYGRFYPDYDMAVAWERLQNGNPLPRDITLLNHELLESYFEEMYNLNASEAHARATEVYDWYGQLMKETDGKGEPDDLL